MLSNLSRVSLLSSWFAVVAIIVSISMALGAKLSTSMLLLVLGVAPACVMLLIGFGSPAPTVAEILHSVDAKDGRS